MRAGTSVSGNVSTPRWQWQLQRPVKLVAIVVDCLCAATFETLCNLLELLSCLRLLCDIGVAFAVLPLEYGWCSLSAKVAIKALPINVDFARKILDITIIEAFERHVLDFFG